MSSKLSMRISICSSMDDRVRLTTKSGTTFDGSVVRTEYVPRTVLLVQPIGFEVAFGEFVPELLRVIQSQLDTAERVEEPVAVPDIDKLRKALEWPVEFGPRSSAANTKRAEKALADASQAQDPERAVAEAIDAGASKGLAPVVARLDAAARMRLLERAAEAGAGAVLTALLVGAADIDLEWLLGRAAAKGQVHAVNALIAAGADVDGVVPLLRGDPNRRSVLYWAVYHGHRAVVRRLLQAGARVTDGAALAWAIVSSPDPVTWGLLLAAGLDVDARDHHGDPLLLALGRNSLKAPLDATIAAGAAVNATYADGSTLLLHAIDHAMQRGTANSPYFIQDLLRAGADPNAGRLYGRNPLALARVVPHNPPESYDPRRIAGWLEAAGAVAAEDPDAPAIRAEKPTLPAWRARIDPTLKRADHYEVLGVRFAASSTEAPLESVCPPGFPWSGLASDTIAVARAKLEFLFGSPSARGDEYKTTFEYRLLATVDDARLVVHISDWKARELCLAVEPHADAALRDRVAAAFWELLTVSPLAVFRDRFRFDDHAGCAYHSDGQSAFAEFPK